jgi:thiamine-phosphate pyrophosphorylase
MMTDERQGEGLWPALSRLPAGAGVVFRHYSLPATERRALYERIGSIARRRGLAVVLAGPPQLERLWRANGRHGGSHRSRSSRIRTIPVHDLHEIRAAERARADLVFLSPVFATRSHPEGRPLGLSRFARLTAATRLPVVALGGMTAVRAKRVERLGAYGWAAIDAWSPRQKRKAVPI